MATSPEGRQFLASEELSPELVDLLGQSIDNYENALQAAAMARERSEAFSSHQAFVHAVREAQRIRRYYRNY